MTMRIKITNEDASRTAIVELVDGESAPVKARTTENAREANGELLPGASTDVWIHAGRAVRVTEK